MPQPTPYARGFSFTDHTANSPSTPQPGVSLDNEFDDIALTAGQIRANLALIQRDDGQLANASVGPDQVSPELTLGLRSVSTWAAGTAYDVNDAVWEDNVLYRALEAHTSAPAFATDLTAGVWEVVFDLMPYVLAALQDGAIEVSIDTAAISAQIATKAGLALANIFLAKQTVSASDAVTLTDYLDLKPTDFGVGKPALRLRKSAAAGTWNVALDDGAAGAGFILDLLIPTGFLKVNGQTVHHAGNFTPADKADLTALTALDTRVVHARRLALAL
jgi:hypothetical protein